MLIIVIVDIIIGTRITCDSFNRNKICATLGPTSDDRDSSIYYRIIMVCNSNFHNWMDHFSTFRFVTGTCASYDLETSAIFAFMPTSPLTGGEFPRYSFEILPRETLKNMSTSMCIGK